jgi:hypothetical protein
MMEEDGLDLGPLAALGLVDPKTGQAVATDDWTPPQQQGPANQDPNGRRADRVEQGQLPENQQPQTHPEVERLERENRELRARMTPADPAADAARNLQARQQELQGYAQQAYTVLTQTPSMDGPNGTKVPYPPHLAQALIQAQLGQRLAEAQLEADRAALLPTAKRQVAESLAKEIGGGVTADDLVSLNSVDAMRAKAETLRDARRDNSFQQRRSGNTDRAEGGSATGVSVSAAIDELPPTEIIKLGVLRGQA